MARWYILPLILSLACSVTVLPMSTIAPKTPIPAKIQAQIWTQTPEVTKTPPPLQITGNVYVRNRQGVVVDSLLKGTGVAGTCQGDWCNIGSGYIWRGCTSDNPDVLGCEAK